MSDPTPHEPKIDPAAVKREPQVLGADELIVYEAIATLRRPLVTGDLIATTGLKEDTVRAALARLSELGMIENGKDGASIGPNDWDVKNAQ
jgi:hypothetical protein